MRIVGMVLVFAFATPVVAYAAPVQWKVAEGGNDHFYEAVYEPARISWNSASTAAGLAGGYLATVSSEAENSFVFELINDPKYWWDSRGCPSGPWLGAFHDAQGWQWVSGDPWSWTNWEPLSSQPLGDGDRVHFFRLGGTEPASTWNDVPGTWGMLGYVVEYSSGTFGPSSVPLPSAAWLGLCLLGALACVRGLRKRSMRVAGLMVVLLFALGVGAQAGTIQIQNHSFESYDGWVPGAGGRWGPWTTDGTGLTGWQFDTPSGGDLGVWRPNPSLVGPSNTIPEPHTTDGIQLAYINLGASDIYQALSDKLQSSVTYTLTADVAQRSYYAQQPGYRLQLLAGGVLLAEDASSSIPAYGSWGEVSVSFTAPSSHPQIGTYLQVRLGHGQLASGQVDWDNVRLSVSGAPSPSPVPLPSAAWLGLGLLGLLGAARRMRRKT